MIKVKNLSVAFNDEQVLYDVNITIPEGERTVIAGRSGSGKSVLMKTVEGIIRPVKGTVLIDDIDIFSLPPNKINALRSKMSLLFQGSALFDSMNIFQNLAFPLLEQTQYDKKRVVELVKEKLSLVGLEGVLDKMPAELSGGMKKRAALARAIINNPKYIFYDEPTTGLDPQISDDIISLILDLQNRLNHTAVIITHELDCIRRAANNIIIMEAGRVRYNDTHQNFLSSKDPCCVQFQ